MYFVDGDLWESQPVGKDNHGLCGLGVFYGKKEIQSQNDTLYFCNFPEVSSSLPFGTCLGSGRPPVKLSNPNWSQILLDWFWGSNFYRGQEWALKLWYEASSTISEVHSEIEWEEFSKQKDCLTAVCNLPWINSEYGLGQMVKVVLEYICKSYEKLNENPIEKRNSQLKLLATQFREQLEEKITFLGAHFSVPQDLAQNARNFLSGKLTNLVAKLTASLPGRCEKLGQNICNQFVEKVNQKGGEDADLSCVDSR